MLEELVSRGYAPGGGLISPSGVFYLNIPKNASSYLTNVLVDNGWEHTVTHDPRIKQNICVLRDPVERWISGFSTYAASWLCGEGYGSTHFLEDYNALSERLIFDQIVFDDHTTEQVKFIEQLDKNITTTYFKLGHSLIIDLESFLDSKLILNNVDDNRAENNYDTKLISERMKYVLNQDPSLKAKIVKRYAADYDLIRTANYYYEPR
jgi:hypothetical protein